MSLFTIFFMFASWSSVFPLGKIVLGHCPPFFLISSRMLLAGVILLGYLALKKPSSFRLSGRQIFSIGIYGLLGMYLNNAFEYWSLQHLSAGKTCFLYSLSPLLAAFFSYLHFKEKMTPRKWLGLGIGLLGIVPALAIETGTEHQAGGFFIFSWPELSMFAAVLCSSYGWILLRLMVKDESVSSSMTNGIGMAIGGVLALAHSYFAEPWTPLPVSGSDVRPFLEGTLLITLISNVMCYNLYGYVLKRFTATFVSFVGLLSPLFAAFNSWLFLGEEPSLTLLLSTGVVILGLWLVYSAELKQGYILKSKTPQTV